MANQFPLEVVLKAVDKATPVLRALTVQVHKLNAPLKGVRLFDQLEGLGKALNVGGLRDAIGGVGSAMGRVGGEVFGLGTKLLGLGALAGTAFYTIVHGAMEAGDKLGEVASRVGLTVDQFASLQFAAAQSDVEAEAFVGAMDKLNKQLGDMTAGKGGEFLAFLNEISPTFAKQVKGAKNTQEAMALITEAFAKIDNPAKRATLAAHAFGKSNLQMGEFLHTGSAAIEEQRQRYLALVGSQNDFAANAGELDNATRETGVAFLGLRNAMAGALFPALTNLSRTLTDFLTKNRESLRAWADKAGAAIQKWLDSGGFERLVDNLGRVANVIGAVVEWLGPLGTGFVATTVLLAPTISALGSLGGALINLGVQAMPALYAAGAALWPALSAGATAGATALWGMVAPLGALMLEFLPVLVIVGSLVLIAKTLRDNWGDLTLIFSNFGETVRNTVNAIFGDGRFEKIMEWVSNPTKMSVFEGLFGATKADAAEAAYQNALAQDARDRELRRSRVGPGGLSSLAASAAPTASAPVSSEAKVSIDFSNLPRGTQVTTDPNSSQPVDLSLGYASVLP